MDGRGVLKSTLTTLSVLGERMKARDPRRSPCEGTACISKDREHPGRARRSDRAQRSPKRWSHVTLFLDPGHISAWRAKVSEATAKALLGLRSGELATVMEEESDDATVCEGHSTSLGTVWGEVLVKPGGVRKVTPASTGGPH